MSSVKGAATAKTGTKRTRTVGDSNDADPKSKEAKLTPSTHTAQLSGATRNMRFMQRGNRTSGVPSSRHSYPPTLSILSSAPKMTNETITNQTTDGDNTATLSVVPLKDSMEANRDGNRNDTTATPKVDSCAIEWGNATPLDMFGQNVCILIGRRSYNGFNSITASNLHMQRQHLDYEEKLQHRWTGTTRSGTPQNNRSSKDQQRYQELSKQVQNEEKRSLNTKGKQSKKKKKTLDDILKLVDP